MLFQSFIWILFITLHHGSAFTTGLERCPGKCVPPEDPCDSPSEKELCGNNLKCCSDSKSSTAEAEMRSESLFEVEASAKSDLILLLRDERVEGSYPENWMAQDEIHECPGMCVSGLDEPFCAYPLKFLLLCDDEKVCCLDEKQAFKIRALMAIAVKDQDSEAAKELKNIFKTGEIGDLDSYACQHHCLLPIHINRCRKRYADYYCPGMTICCDEDLSVPIEALPEKCDGKCVPPQLRYLCQPPQVLAPAQDCNPPTLCCMGRFRSRRKQYPLYLDETDEYSYESENFTESEEFDSKSGMAWMVADPQNRLWEQYKSSTSESQKSDGTVFREPLPYSSEEFFIPDENTAESEPDLSTRPLCPGSCMSYYTRFLCFRNYSTYEGFYCPDRSVCCAKLEDIEKHEEFLKATYPFLQGNFRELNLNCGRKVKGEIPESLPGGWCWQVALIDVRNQYICGGALIDESWAITTAQCVAGYVSQNQPVFIRAGVNDLSNPEDNAVGQTRAVSTSYLHYSYDPSTLDNDIALLKLQKPISLDTNVCLACLPTKLVLPRDGSLCTLTGYAFVSDDDEMSLKMTKAQVPLLHDVDCISNLTETLSTVYMLPASSFCAGHEKNYCQGASGNPLVCIVDDHYELVGLVSWSVGCHLPGAPSVFMKTSALLGWINHVIAMDKQLYPETA